MKNRATVTFDWSQCRVEVAFDETRELTQSQRIALERIVVALKADLERQMFGVIPPTTRDGNVVQLPLKPRQLVRALDPYPPHTRGPSPT